MVLGVILGYYMEISRENERGIIELPLEMSTRIVSFKLEDNIIDIIDKIAKEEGYTNRSDLIRVAIDEFLAFLKTSGV